jgi:hypothetical protein
MKKILIIILITLIVVSNFSYGPKALAQSDSSSNAGGVLGKLKTLGINVFNGMIQIAKLFVFELKTKVFRITTKAGQDNSIGSGEIPANTIEYMVNNSLVEATSKIFITFNSDTGRKTSYISEKIPGKGFVIRLSSVVSEPLKFDYWIILVGGDVAIKDNKQETRFDWTTATTEIKELRTYNTKDFPDPNDPTKRIRIESSGLLHAYTDKGFEDIKTELPNYEFPEGTVLTEQSKEQYLMDLPSWGTAKVEDNGKTVRVYDKKGTPIYRYVNPIVVHEDVAPFEVVSAKDGKKVKDVFDEKEQIGQDEKIVNSDTVDEATFKIKKNKIYFNLPANLKNQYPLKAYDSTDTSATNNGDAFIELSYDTNYGSWANLWSGIPFAGSSYENRALINFTLPSGSGTIVAVKLYARVIQRNNSPIIEVHELTYTGWTELGVTWYKYDGTNNWPGGLDANISATIVASGAAIPWVPWWQSWDIGPGATNPISGLTWGSVINLCLKEGTRNNNYVANYSSRNGSDPPYIEITYTITAPTVTTTAISSITDTTASSGGNVTSDGGATVTARGVCWNTTGTPTITDSKTSDGTGTGVFTSSLTGLDALTKYYVRAYATNETGTSYGSEVNFTTLPGEDFIPPIIIIGD